MMSGPDRIGNIGRRLQEFSSRVNTGWCSRLVLQPEDLLEVRSNKQGRLAST